MPPEHVEFALRYIEHGYNARRAVEACDTWKVTTADSAYVQGSRLLRDAKIREFVALSAEESFFDARVSIGRVLEELARLAFFDIRNLYHDDGRLKDPQELTAEEASVIVGITNTIIGYEGKGSDKAPITKVEYKLANKERALEMLGKYHKLFADSLIEVKVDLGEELAKARQRVREARAKQKQQQEEEE